MMSVRKWIYFTFINLLIVACLGLILRYKITFSLPLVNQKFLQHGHSHFALTGWITQLLMVLVSYRVSIKIGKDYFQKYQWILWLNIVASFGMVLSFPFQGYGAVSIAFSTLAIVVSYLFAAKLWVDMGKVKEQDRSFKWFKASQIFSVLSSLGVYIMIYFMITHSGTPSQHSAALYLFLHFQYNGWFIFGIFGLLEDRLQLSLNASKMKAFYWVNAVSCIPVFFLSAPWLPLPGFVMGLSALAGVAIFLAWVWLAVALRKNIIPYFSKFPRLGLTLLGLSAIAYTIKTFLQMGSAVPELSKIAFGFRPISVGYLHLVFLGVVSLFLIGYVLGWKVPHLSKVSRIGLGGFVLGIILSELALMVQGVFAISYTVVPYINEIIFAVTVLMVLGLIAFVAGLSPALKKESIPQGEERVAG